MILQEIPIGADTINRAEAKTLMRWASDNLSASARLKPFKQLTPGILEDSGG